MNLSGTWRGQYSFDEDPNLSKLPSRPIPFEMTLKHHFLGIISGATTDDPRNGFAEPGKIRGRLTGDTLRFKKLFPKLRILHEGKNQTLVDWAEKWGFVLDDPDEPHPAIHFLATLSEGGQSLSGSWRTPETDITIPGANGPLHLPALTGTWSATRNPPS